jgi:tetratricopeptide (TPR) repeat protein
MPLDETLARGLRHHQEGRLAEAEALYRRILAADAEHAEALHLLGVLAQQVGRPDVAAELIGKATQRAADPRYFNNLGTAQRALQRLDDAALSYRRALELRPDFAEALSNLAAVLQEQGDLAAAEDCLRRALALQPAFAEAEYNLANLLRARGDGAAAITHYRAALALAPGFFDAHLNLGAALAEAGELAAAAEACRQALALRPNDAVAHNNLGNVLVRLDDLAGAVRSYERAALLAPRYAPALSNLGNALAELGNFAAAADAYRRAVAVEPEHAEAHWGLALARLSEGDCAAGFALYEWRRRVPGFAMPPPPPVPQWRGEPLGGASILLHAEQGFGDTLQFLRYLPAVAARGGRIVLEVPTDLHRLLAGIPQIERLLAAGEPHPPLAWHCPLPSLPLACGTTLATIPADVPYLIVPPEAAARWPERVRAEGLRVGLAWAGNPRQKRDGQRSMSLAALAPLGAVDGVRFFSLQKGAAAAQLAAAPFPIVDLSSDLADFAETAAAAAALDLVISVDTSVAHLAGALGLPVWVMLAHVADWRWLSGRDGSPWYPTARLFRQPRRGDWGEVAARVAAALAALR